MRRACSVAVLSLVLWLAACASRTPLTERDGVHAQTPAGLERTPDAVPRIEPIRLGGPNKPYEALGYSVVPLTGDVGLREQGLASWYGNKYHGRPTSSGVSTTCSP